MVCMIVGQDKGIHLHPAPAEQILCRFQNSEHHIFDIECAATPDVSAIHCAGEGVMRPVFFCTSDYRYHILMRHVQAWQQILIRTGYCDQHRVPDKLKCPRLHDSRKASLHQFLQPVKFPEICQGVLGIVNGFAAHRLRKVFHSSGGVQICVEIFSCKVLRNSPHDSLSSR